MQRHRLLVEAPIYRLPRPPAPEPAPGSFVLCPLFLTSGLTVEQWTCRQWLYQWALEQARETVRPSLPERDLLAVWN
jgi:hypothetical protein